MFRLVFFLGLLSISHFLNGQAPLCEAYTFSRVSLGKNALSGAGLFNLCQDTLGQIWAHNQKHLIRIGTHSATVFAGSGKKGIAGDIQELFTTYDGNLWVVTDQQLYELDPLRQLFTPHYIVYKNDTLKTGALLACSYRAGLVVRSSRGGVYYYNASTKQTSLLLQLAPTPLLYVKCKQGNYKNVLLTSKEAIYNIESDGKILRTPLADSLGSLDEVAELSPSTYLTYHLNARLYKLDAATGDATFIEKLPADVQRNMYAITLHGIANIALNDPNGIYLYNKNTGRLTHWSSGLQQAGEKLQGWTLGMLQDRTGRFWILNNETILHLPPTLQQPGTTAWWPHKEEFATAFDPKLAYSNLIAADRYGPFVLNTYYNELQVYDTTNGRLVQKVAVTSTGHNRDFFCLLQADSTHWLVGCKTGYLVYDTKANQLLPTNTNDPLNAFFGIIEGKDSFYCHARLGLATISRTNLLKAAFRPMQGKVRMETDGQGNIWLMTLKGIFKKTATGQWLPLTGFLEKEITYGGSWLLYNRFSNRLVLLGDNGLYELNPNTGAILRQTSLNNSGLPSEYIYVEPISADELWLGTSGGPAIVYNIATGGSYTLGANVGWWPENLGFSTHIAADAGGSYWVTHDAGFMQVRKAFFRPPSQAIAPPAISELLLQYKPWPMHPAMYAHQPLEVSYKTGQLAMRMEADEPDSIEYLLEPYDKEWHRGNIANYTNLDGGNYLFKSRVAGAYGLASAETRMQLKIIPPVWKQWWFRIAMALVTSLLAWWFVRRRIVRQRKDLQLKVRLAESELKAIRSQMNPHFIFNCMTAIDGLIATNQRHKASEYLGKFSKLMRQVLQLSEKQFVPLEEDLATLKLYLQLEQMRMMDGFSWTINASPHLLEGLEVPPMLLQPFVENAIIHGLKPKAGADKELLVSCVKENNQVIFTIKDNGVGRQKNKPASGHQSMGTQLTADRLALMEEVLGITTQVQITDLAHPNGAPAGTHIQITLTDNVK